MTNRPTSQAVARVRDDPTIRRLRELAAQEAAATKERLATRTAAARLFSGAGARLAETTAAWEHAQAEAQRTQAEAVKNLVGSGMELGQGDRTARHLEEGRPELGREEARKANECDWTKERAGGNRSATHAPG